MQPRKLIRQKLLMRGTPYHDQNYSELDDHFEEESTACAFNCNSTQPHPSEQRLPVTVPLPGVSVTLCWSIGGSTSTLYELFSAINKLTGLFTMTTCNSFDIDAKLQPFFSTFAVQVSDNTST